MSFRREIDAVRSDAGLWMRRGHAVLQVCGADAVRWLHAQTTNTIAGLASGQGNLNALLDRQGRVRCVFSAHRIDDEVWLVLDRAQTGAIMARVESHVFLEEVRVAEVGEGTPQICIEGPRAPVFLAHLLDADPEAGLAQLPAEAMAFAACTLRGREVLVFRMTESGEDGYLIVPAPGEAEAVYGELAAEAPGYLVAEISGPARDALRFESGLPEFGVDFDAEDPIMATPLERLAVAYDKGCYLGQEVVARVKAYGSPKLALAYLLAGDAADLPAARAPLHVAGQRAGEFRRALYSPALGGWLCAAMLDRERRVPDSQWRFEHARGGFDARVLLWPALEPPARAANAQRLYHEALARFDQDAADRDATVIETLREALLLAPEFEDAYEALGVILHRHQRVDEAISVMKRLEGLNPNSVMAHTNLSVFYVAKGMIAEAEAEKAKAAQLEFKRELDARAAEKAAAAERACHEAEAAQRIAMFHEVLAIDPEDPIATMGLASAYMTLGRYADALGPLETAVRVQRDYSAAYLNLGKCREFLGHRDAAKAAYREGIAAASRKGDLMPLREMERRLKALESHD